MARKNIAKLLNTFSILEAGDLEGIKAKTLWFFAIIIRMASESDSNLNQIIDTDLDIINRISEAESFNELLTVSENIIETVTKNTLSSIYRGRSQIVTKALQYINKNYKEKLSLKDIETNLHVNSSYFSTLFKQGNGRYLHRLSEFPEDRTRLPAARTHQSEHYRRFAVHRI